MTPTQKGPDVPAAGERGRHSAEQPVRAAAGGYGLQLDEKLPHDSLLGTEAGGRAMALHSSSSSSTCPAPGGPQGVRPKLRPAVVEPCPVWGMTNHQGARAEHPPVRCVSETSHGGLSLADS